MYWRHHNRRSSCNFNFREHNHISILSHNSNNIHVFEILIIWKQVFDFNKDEFLEILNCHSFKSLRHFLDSARRISRRVLRSFIDFKFDGVTLIWTIDKISSVIINTWDRNVYKSFICCVLIVDLSLVLNVIFFHVDWVQFAISFKSSGLNVKIRKVFFNAFCFVVWPDSNNVFNGSFIWNLKRGKDLSELWFWVLVLVFVFHEIGEWFSDKDFCTSNAIVNLDDEFLIAFWNKSFVDFELIFCWLNTTEVSFVNS